MQIEVNIDPAVFNAAYLPYLDDMRRVQIYYGGSSSGKSKFLAQRTVYDILKGGRNYLVTRAVGRTIRRSVFAEIRKVIAEWQVANLFSVNKAEMIITCQNGYQIHFAGLDDPEKLKSITPDIGVITDVWAEEATEVSENAIKQLFKRQRGGSEAIKKRLTMSFNPIIKSHWIFNQYFKPNGWGETQTLLDGDDLLILKTWYIHNRFLTQGDIDDLENEQDDYYKQVYTYGNWGVLGDVIFKNWEVVDLSEMKAQADFFRFGLDFGFSNDPAAFVQSRYDERAKAVYIFDEIYERGLTNNELGNLIKPIASYYPVMCDSSEPKSIEELKRMGIAAQPCSKGKDSVLHGIQWLQGQKIYVDVQCVNTQHEFSVYQWKKDKFGESISVPSDKNNHAVDSIRYAHEEDMIPASPVFW